MKNFINRQKLRRALIIFSFLLLPATFAYISCPIIIEAASKGIASGGLIIFIFKRNTPQLAADGIKGMRIQLGLGSD